MTSAMAEEEAKSGAEHSRGKKKRRPIKQHAEDGPSRPSKSRRVDDSADEEGQEASSNPMVQKDGPWRNLQLILSLQDKGIDVGKLVSLLSLSLERVVTSLVGVVLLLV